MTNSSIIYNNKLHTQKEYFLFVISDTKSLQLILKFYENGFSRILISNFKLSDRSVQILIDTHTDSMPGGTFPVHL